MIPPKIGWWLPLVVAVVFWGKWTGVSSFTSAGEKSEQSQRKRYVVNRQGDVPHPVVAVAGVTAWPNLTLLQDGSILASLFNKPSHGEVAGEVECWVSSDSGKTWARRGVPIWHQPNTNRMNHAVGLANNGDLLAMISGWSDLPMAGQASQHPGPFRAAVLDPVVCRSRDVGRTWTTDFKSLPARCPDDGVTIPFGDIVPGADGELRVAVYSAKGIVGLKPGSELVFVYRSHDDGLTWSDPVSLSAPHHRNETAILHLGRGHWIAAARYHNLALFRSEDDSQSWNFQALVTGKSEFPGHLIRLRDGRILLTHGNRTEDRGVDARFSADEGVTWSQSRRVMDFQGDGGYPSSVQLADGQILTAYYAKSITGYDSYHMGVVTWDPNKLSN